MTTKKNQNIVIQNIAFGRNTLWDAQKVWRPQGVTIFPFCENVLKLP